MKRRFRITITPDNSYRNLKKLHDFVHDNWGLYFHSTNLHFRGFDRKNYCAGIEVLDKTAKAL